MQHPAATGSAARSLLRSVRRNIRRAAAGTRTTIPVTSAPVEPEVPRWSACYAPHSSMYFDQFGMVRACCQNTGVYLGDAKEQSLREIWESADAARMRSALEVNDFSVGCDFCEWQVREGNDGILFARSFDHLRPEERRPAWPRQMEFSLTNTCNLQCAMCNGHWSSTIRAKRERLEPLPPAYGEDFFVQLVEFLPHLELARFLGGEPFLGSEPLRVMEMLLELPEPPEVNITTNGTVWTPRVRRIIEALSPTIVVSIDGASAAVYESIRIGARFDDVMTNLDRFCEAVGSSSVSIAHCLMTSNWHEFADLLALAEARRLEVGINVVRFPEEQSLYHLGPSELEPIVRSLQATSVELTGSRAELWQGHVEALAHRLEVVRSPATGLGPKHGLPGAPEDDKGAAPALSHLEEIVWLPFRSHIEQPPASGHLVPTEPPVSFTVLADGSITGVTSSSPAFGAALDAIVDGGSVAEFVDRLEARYGPLNGWEFLEIPDPDIIERFRMRPVGPHESAPFTIAGIPRRDDVGNLIDGQFWIEPATPDDTASGP